MSRYSTFSEEVTIYITSYNIWFKNVTVVTDLQLTMTFFLDKKWFLL